MHSAANAIATPLLREQIRLRRAKDPWLTRGVDAGYADAFATPF